MALSIGTDAPDFALSSKGAYALKIVTPSENLESFESERTLGMSAVAKRSAFILDKSGLIRYAASSNSSKGLPKFEAIKAELRKLA